MPTQSFASPEMLVEMVEAIREGRQPAEEKLDSIIDITRAALEHLTSRSQEVTALQFAIKAILAQEGGRYSITYDSTEQAVGCNIRDYQDENGNFVLELINPNKPAQEEAPIDDTPES